MMQLNYFTQVHRYDERKTFKEAWKKWIQTNEIAEMIASETARLTSDGFRGDVEDKMFKAVRYYFRKKPTKPADEPVEKTPRKKYVGFTGNILTAMDKHIIECIKENLCKIEEKTADVQETPEVPKKTSKKYKSNVSPDKAYNDFCMSAIEIILRETELLREEENMDHDDIALKLKKTYKNRYQTIRKKLSEIEYK
jgi:hypothetical protein